LKAVIKKTIILSIVIFIAYNVLLLLKHPVTGPGQHQWQKNRILIEDYVDYHEGVPVVIVGTSLSARLYPSLLPSGYFNLALAGESIFDGLEIVKKSTKKPEYILVETNIFYKKPDKDLSEGVFNPMMLWIRKYIPSFREENQPANLLPPLIAKAGKGEAVNTNSADTAILNTLLKQKVADYQQVPDSVTMTENLKLLKDYIRDFQAKGIKVVLYEIPVNCKLYQTPRYLVPKQKLTAAFPDRYFQWLSMPDCSAYQYGDGEHLALESSVKFVDWFVKALHQSGVKP